jgi:hypothetical protein
MLRFARWCAVSTHEQAQRDKFSIPSQLERTRNEALARAWVETAGPFVVSGQSRTKYIQLDQASAQIEPLRLMLQSARAGQFDILVMTEFDRLRELLDQVFRTLASLHIQLYSIAQPIEPVPPHEYSIHQADSVAMLIGLSQITSRLEISRTRRKWYDGMPKRITALGLPAAHIPYGYRKPIGQEHNRKAIPEPDPTLAPHIIKLKDLLLAGHSTTQLIDYLEDRRLRPPKSDRWHAQTVRDILKNPFYAGIVQFGKSRVVIDPQTGARRRNRLIPRELIQTNTGRHTPLWDDACHQNIIHEFKRRSKSYRGRVNNQFTGLVKCGICGSAMWRQENGPRAHRLIWRCSASSSTTGKGANGEEKPCRNSIPHDILLHKVGLALVSALHPYIKLQYSLSSPETDLHQRAITELKTKLDRLEDAYLAGQWDLTRYSERKASIQNDIAEHQNAILQSQHETTQHRAWIESLEQFQRLDNLPHWLETNNPAKTNRTLSLLLRSILIRNEIEIIFN